MRHWNIPDNIQEEIIDIYYDRLINKITLKDNIYLKKSIEDVNESFNLDQLYYTKTK